MRKSQVGNKKNKPPQKGLDIDAARELCAGLLDLIAQNNRQTQRLFKIFDGIAEAYGLPTDGKGEE